MGRLASRSGKATMNECLSGMKTDQEGALDSQENIHRNHNWRHGELCVLRSG